MALIYSGESVAYRLKANVWESDANIANNTSIVHVDLYLQGTKTAVYSVNKPQGNSFWINIHGQRMVTRTVGFNINGTQTKHVLSVSRTVTHRDDGSMSVGIDVGMDVSSRMNNYDPASLRGSGNVSLTKINRLTTGTLNKSQYNVGEQMTISLNKHVSSYTTTLKWAWHDDAHNQLIASNANKFTGTSFTATIPSDFLCQVLPTSTSGWGAVEIHTMNGDTDLGFTRTENFDLNIPNTAAYQPTLNFNVTEGVSSIASNVGALIKGKSSFKIQPSSLAGKLSATIVRLTAVVQGVTYTVNNPTTSSVISTNVISASGSIPVKVTATDSRGYSTTVAKNVTVYDYFTPSLSVSAYRCNANGSANDDATQVKVSFTVNHSPVTVSGTNKNGVTVRVYKSTDGSNWGSAIYTTTGTGSCITNSGTFPVASTTYIKVTADDKAGSSVYKTYTMGPAFKLISWGAGGRSVAFGKKSSNDGRFEVAMPAQIQLQDKYQGVWLQGKTPTNNAMYLANNLPNSTYVPLLGMKTAAGHSISVGAISEQFGIWTYNKDRTTNGTDGGLYVRASDGGLAIDLGTTFSRNTHFANTMTFSDAAKLSLVNLIHPVGKTLLLLDGVDPNTLYPGTTWEREYMMIASAVDTNFIVRPTNAQVKNCQTLETYYSDGSPTSRWNLFLTTSKDAANRRRIAYWIRTA